MAGGEVPVDPKVHEALCGDELGLVEVDNDSQLRAQIDEAEARVCEALSIARQEKPVVDVLKRHDVIVLTRVGLQCCKDFSEDLWQRTESERRRLKLLIKTQRAPLAQLESIRGKLCSMEKVVPFGRINFRFFQALVTKHLKLGRHPRWITITHEAVTDLRWWSEPDNASHTRASAS